jgi:cytochrome c553
MVAQHAVANGEQCPGADRMWTVSMRLSVLILLASVHLIAASEADARRVLAARCWTCHSQMAAGGLRLDTKAGLARGGKSGAVLGNPEESLLLRAVRRQPGVKAMPPGAPLSAREASTLEQWLREGAPWTEEQQHWAFAPIAPLQKSQSIDGIINASLQKRGLPPNAKADARTLQRRLSMDLTGLPSQQSVEQLLASPRFGEKWGRHWLDVARYGEDDFSGTAVQPYANAWRFRDWVVSALNADMPYDRFLMAQIAGDQMNDPSLLPATGLFGLGPWYYGISQPPQARADERNDRVDMVARGMLGVTLACARCHDHKYDPFSIRDYYALAGVFANTAYREYPLVSEAEVKAWQERKEEHDAAEKKLKDFLDEQQLRLGRELVREAPAYMLATLKDGKSNGLHRAVLERWRTYLAKPEEFHPFLKDWFAAKSEAAAKSFSTLLLSIDEEKTRLDAENQRIVEAGKKLEAKSERLIVLPGGYRSEEDFNPGAFIESKSLERDRYVAWNRTFADKAAPLNLGAELTASLLQGEPKERYRQLAKELALKKKALPAKYGFVAGSAEAAYAPWELRVHLRGNPEQLGEETPRRFPLVLSNGKALSLREGSGRRQLAEVVAHHPLAARVAVNRIWMALFGQGLVRTPSNFGLVGDRPVLPELLDYLAARFVAEKYSVKALIREIVASDAYQRSSATHTANAAVDPDNRLLWRQTRRRLEAEAMRDAMLQASGELQESIGGPSAELNAAFLRRTIYAKTSRFQQDETLSLFDLPAAAVTCEQRVVTNVPLQKLYLLNSDDIAARARSLAQRIRHRNHEAGIANAYQLLFSREASAEEKAAGVSFLREAKDEKNGMKRWEQYAQVLLNLNEFAYVD